MNQEETMLLHKERYKETIKNLTVMSDILARNVFKDKNACEYVLRIILEDKELTVIDNETQMDFRNMPTTSLRFAFSFVIFFSSFRYRHDFRALSCQEEKESPAASIRYGARGRCREGNRHQNQEEAADA